MMAIPNSHGISPLNLSLSSSRINPFIPTASLHSYCNASHVRCKNSLKNSVVLSPISVADRVLMDIHNSGIIACLRAQSAEVAIEAARAALRGGVTVLEITMSTPDVFEVGTVLDRGNAKDALKFGVKCLMSPATVKGILDDVAEGQALYIPGATTPTDVYPVSALGGVEYIAAVKKPFPHIPMVASQGIALDSVRHYIAQGASSVVLSDDIFDKKAMAEQDFLRIEQLASFAAVRGNEVVRYHFVHLRRFTLSCPEAETFLEFLSTIDPVW